MILPNEDDKLISTNTMFIHSRKLASILNYIFNQNCQFAAIKCYIVKHFKWAVPFSDSLNQYIILPNRIVNWPQLVNQYIIFAYNVTNWQSLLRSLMNMSYLQPTL